MTTTTLDPPGTTTAAATDSIDDVEYEKKPAADNSGLGMSMHSSTSAATPLEDIVEGEDDAEEALFLDIEKEEGATAEDGAEISTNPELAPTLLKAALKKGELSNGEAVGTTADAATAEQEEPSTETNATEAKVRKMKPLV
jgi:hypothetical protein